jgi:hypothetical protein
MKILERSVGDRKIIWFEGSNRYSIVEMPAYEVIVRLARDEEPASIISWVSENYELPESESSRFVEEIRQMAEKQSKPDEPDPGAVTMAVPDEMPETFNARRIYRINQCSIAADYGDDVTEHLIHPKLAHLEPGPGNEPDHCFQVFRYLGKYVLRINGTVIGTWMPEDSHYLTGKFSMELLNRMYGRHKNDWMGVFHASAISKGRESVLFLGDSGSGKSTACSILMASGFGLVADDFVAVDALTWEACYFPAAVSVKKTALDHLLPIYPQLGSAVEFYYPGLDKTVRYLAPNIQRETNGSGFPCKALVFVKYRPGSGMVMEKLSQDIAFQYLVPDSWISPVAENAQRFLDWFLGLPCYRLTYDDNEKMVGAVGDLF